MTFSRGIAPQVCYAKRPTEHEETEQYTRQSRVFLWIEQTIYKVFLFSFALRLLASGAESVLLVNIKVEHYYDNEPIARGKS